MSAVSTQQPVYSMKRTMQAQGANQLRGLALVQGGGGDLFAAVCAAANAQCIGIQEETSINAGDTISVIEGGDAVGIAGAAIAAGAYVIATATGQLITSTAIGDEVVGRAKTSAAAQGDEFLLLVDPFIR